MDSPGLVSMYSVVRALPGVTHTQALTRRQRGYGPGRNASPAAPPPALKGPPVRRPSLEGK